MKTISAANRHNDRDEIETWMDSKVAMLEQDNPKSKFAKFVSR